MAGKKFFVIYICILLTVPSACGRQQIQPDKLQPAQIQVPVVNATESPPPAEASASMEAMNPTDKTEQELQIPSQTITDINSWSHPVKTLFEGYETHSVIGKLQKVELYEDNTYPVFYTNLVPDYYTLLSWDITVEPVLQGLAKANGGWDFEIRNLAGSIQIKAVCDQQTDSILQLRINQWDSIQDFLVNFRDKDFVQHLNGLTTKEIRANVVCSGDLDGDGRIEYLYKYTKAPNYRSTDYYLLQEEKPGRYRNLGLLIDDYSVGHIITGENILQLDAFENKKYIVLDAAHNATFAYGYFIYAFDGLSVSRPFINFPGATAHGARELLDSDGDGVYEHLSYHEMNDYQKHLLIEVTSFRDGKTDYILEYQNEEGRFVYPEKAEEVVQCYIEAQCLFWQKPDEILDELASMVARKELLDRELGFYPNTIANNGIELTIKLLEGTESKKVIEARDSHQDSYKADFTLIKQNGLWQIDHIEKH